AIRDGRDAENDIKQTERLLTNARAECVRIEQCDTYNEVQGFVSEIADELSSDPLGVDTIHMRREAFMRTFEAETESVRQECDRDREKVLGAMAKFLSSFPMSDLDATVASLPSFLALEERIRHEDLPRHTDRFKVSLNEKVIGDIGLFRGQLDYERHSIASRIEVLNESLKTVDFRPGTFIQIEARETSNAEIVEFRKQLRDCIGDTERDDAESNEFRYDRIRKLVDRLGDENERRWRERVVDVRQWFNFVANVTDRHTLERVSSYDDSTGQSGGEKAKLAFTILVAAIAYQYDLCLDEEHRTGPETDRFRFVMVDEMFSKVDDQHARYALDLFQKFGLHLLIVAPLDAKACVCEPYVGSYLIVQKGDDAHSEVLEITARQFEELGSDPPAGPPR
ncbi:MAG: SbcC/MukB-like Walker B domain-containing protein, partial [Planctomycetota bacterium]